MSKRNAFILVLGAAILVLASPKTALAQSGDVPVSEQPSGRDSLTVGTNAFDRASNSFVGYGARFVDAAASSDYEAMAALMRGPVRSAVEGYRTYSADEFIDFIKNCRWMNPGGGGILWDCPANQGDLRFAVLFVLRNVEGGVVLVGTGTMPLKPLGER